MDNVLLGIFASSTMILYIVGGYCVYRSILEYRGMRELKKQPTIPISLIEEGPVEIRGWARPLAERPLISPLSRNPCIYYHVLVEKKITTRNSTKWITVHSKGDSLDMMVVDDTGSVLIRPAGADFKGAEKIEYQTNLFKEPGPTLLSFIEREGIRHKGILGLMRETMRYTEYYVPPGGYMYILGNASFSPPGEYGSDGQGVVPYVIRSVGRGGPFIISDRSERWLLSRHRRKFIGFLTGSILMFIIPLLMYILFMAFL